MQEPITVETFVHAPLEVVWHAFTDTESVKQWNAASDDWHTPEARNDLQQGGRFLYRMEAKDGSIGFDFGGTYSEIREGEYISYAMDDGREVEVTFVPEGDGVRVVEIFDPEHENELDMQRTGWQSILDNFKAYVEAQQSSIVNS